MRRSTVLCLIFLYIYDLKHHNGLQKLSHAPWTNFSLQDKTWAELSTPGLSVLEYAVQLHT
jgi:hypothetical protein